MRLVGARTQQARCLQRHFSQQTAARSRALGMRQVRQQPRQYSVAGLQQSSVELPPELADYRPNVGVCVVNTEGLVFAARRCKDPTPTWQMPQGGIDEGETPLQAALRELTEETSIHSIELLAEAPDWLHYDFPPEVRQRLHGTWERYKGQAQRWFLFKFTGDDSEVNLDTAHKEFSEWRWMPLKELPDVVIPFKRKIYKAVAAHFSPLIQQHVVGAEDVEHS
eukprot:GHUV01010514.1.p1 GENE.GHUV01010514.1~~GHUV01010514.1.p1  ORF type:complete len:223 (+),score=45.19 GHUV01010514.1:161-829(+)